MENPPLTKKTKQKNKWLIKAFCIATHQEGHSPCDPVHRGYKNKEIAQNVGHFQSAVGILSQYHVCQGDNGRLYAVETCVRLKRFPQPAGIKPGTAGSV